MTAAPETAEPVFKYGTLKFEKPATTAQIAAARAKLAVEGKTAFDRLRLSFRAADDATLAAALAQFPEACEVDVDKTPLKTLAPFATLKNLQSLTLKNLPGADLSPLAACTRLRKISLSYCTVADLAPLGGLQELCEAEFYGSKLTSFASLATCPKLDRIYFYAAELPPEGYASLGMLKQVKKFHGGLTKMTSVAWLRDVPQAEEVKLFAEKISDLTPLQTLPNLTYLRLWNMAGDRLSCAVGDLAVLANNRKLRILELPGSAYTNTGALSALGELERVDLSGAKNPVDVAFVAKLSKLKYLNLNRTAVQNGAAVAALPKEVRVSKDAKTTGL